MVCKRLLWGRGKKLPSVITITLLSFFYLYSMEGRISDEILLSDDPMLQSALAEKIKTLEKQKEDRENLLTRRNEEYQNFIIDVRIKQLYLDQDACKASKGEYPNFDRGFAPINSSWLLIELIDLRFHQAKRGLEWLYKKLIG